MIDNNTSYGASPPFVCFESPTVRKDCEKLLDPDYGSVRIYGSYAYYSCDYGYSLVGSYYRACQNGYWLGSAPYCVKEKRY